MGLCNIFCKALRLYWEKDYKIVWTEVERHFGATKHTNDTKEKSDK